MAEGYGNVVGHWQAYVKAWVSSETADTATIICECYFNPRGWGFQVNGLGSAAISGQSGSTNYTTFSRPRGSWSEQWVANKTLTITKTGYTQNISCGAYVRVTGGYENGESWAGCTVTVGARQYQGHGTPTFSISPIAVGVGQKSRLTWGRAANQGNARFDHFEIWENHRKIYSGGGTSLDVIPANATPLPDNPDNVFYEVVEVHEWYGQYPQTITSKWVAVTRLAKPAQPRITTPQNGATVASDEKIPLRWIHNATDRTPEQQAVIELYPDADTNTSRTYNLTGNIQRIDINPLTAHGRTSKWRVKTKGAHPDWSDWSDFSFFSVIAKPQVAFTPITEVTQFPLDVSWTFTDENTNTQASWELTVSQGTNTFTARGSNANSKTTILGTELEVKNNVEITFRLTVVSTTGLSAQTTLQVPVHYRPPAAPLLTCMLDDTRLVNKVYVNAGIDSDAAPTTTIALYRDDVLIAENLRSGDAVEDLLPPLDTEMVYRAVAYASSGAIQNTSIREYITSKNRVAINFGEDYSDILLVGLDIDASYKVEREKELFESAAYTAPVAIFGTHKQAQGSIKGKIFEGNKPYGTRDKLLILMDWGKDCIIRLPVCGYVIAADLDVDISSFNNVVTELSIDWKEIANGAIT